MYTKKESYLNIEVGKISIVHKKISIWFYQIFLTIFLPIYAFCVIPRYSLFEVYDINNRSYNNLFDFEEIKYEVKFLSPEGQIYKVLGFYDGLYNGNQVWRARIAPMDIGVWKYSALFSDETSAGSGEFEVVPSALHGPVVRDPDHPFKFMHHDRTPIFILGNTVYNILGATESEWEVVLSNQLKLCSEVGFNKVRFAPYAEHEYKNNPAGWNAHPWHKSTDSTIDYSRYDLSHWRKIEEMIQRFGLQGVIADFIFVMHELKIDDGLGDSFSKQRNQYYRYAVARLHGFWNVAWDLENEANEIHATENFCNWINYDMTWYNTFGGLIVHIDPYLQHEPPGFGRMLGVHDNNTPPNFSWMNHSKLQWKTTVPQGLLFRIDPLINTSYRGQKYEIDITRNGKPVIYEEYGYEGEQILEYFNPAETGISQEIKTDNLLRKERNKFPGLPHSKGDKGDRQRRAIWTITTCGAFGTYGDKTTLFDDSGNQIDPIPYGKPYISGDIRGTTEVGTRYLTVLASFIRNRVNVNRLQTMVPSHELITDSEITDIDQTVWKQHNWLNYPNPPEPRYPMAFCLADIGETYLIYLPYGGWIELNLSPVKGSEYQVIWLDPRNGEEISGNPKFIAGNKTVRFSPPWITLLPGDPGDWVLYVENKR